MGFVISPLLFKLAGHDYREAKALAEIDKSIPKAMRIENITGKLSNSPIATPILPPKKLPKTPENLTSTVTLEAAPAYSYVPNATIKVSPRGFRSTSVQAPKVTKTATAPEYIYTPEYAPTVSPQGYRSTSVLAPKVIRGRAVEQSVQPWYQRAWNTSKGYIAPTLKYGVPVGLTWYTLYNMINTDKEMSEELKKLQLAEAMQTLEAAGYNVNAGSTSASLALDMQNAVASPQTIVTTESSSTSTESKITPKDNKKSDSEPTPEEEARMIAHLRKKYPNMFTPITVSRPLSVKPQYASYQTATPVVVKAPNMVTVNSPALLASLVSTLLSPVELAGMQF